VCVDQQKFRWLLSYYDAQVLYPERFTLSLLLDARQIALKRGLQFNVFTYHQAELHGRRTIIHPVDRGDLHVSPAAAVEFKPSAIVNATGAWVDRTLQQIGITTNGLMGGTKGSHFISHNERLRRCLNGKGIYAEAPDGRPIFILPFGNGTLVGTTDEPFAGDPADAVADASELEYLLQAVNEIAPQVGLAPSDVELHYSGVRPLPRVDASTPGAITRRHWMQEIPAGPVPLYCIIGGKLTTCRSLAEDSAATLLARLGKAVQETSRERPIPGSEGFPTDAIDQRFRIEQLGLHHGLTEEQVRAIWSLGGTRYERILEQSNNSSTENLAGTQLPLGVVRAVIRDEWVTTLNDLVERRLMLVFHPGLTAACLHQLADLMVAEGKLPAHAVEMEVERTRRRLSQHFGKQVQPA
jgi:glycerol-3-phosphate dehydrogenase